MPRPFRSVTLRTRLLMLGAGAVVSLALLAATSATIMTSIRGKTQTSSVDQARSIVLSHAFEAWIRNDDQNNMYAAVIALRDPKQHKLAEVTWGEAAAAYRESSAQIAKLRPQLSTRPRSPCSGRSARASRASTRSAKSCARTPSPATCSGRSTT